jgi:hypothetical protein
MIGAGGIIKAIVALAIVVIIAGGAWYVTGLRADLAVSELNNQKLKDGIEAQQRVMDQMRADISQIQSINTRLAEESERQRQEVRELTDKFNVNARGEARDFGAIAAARPTTIQRLINRGSANAIRCLEIASGSPHTEQELAAKILSETNRECPTLANPNYIPTGN